MDHLSSNDSGMLLGFEGSIHFKVPGSISQHLIAYQKDGVQFLYDHYNQDEGAILADDTGLGKTIQAIAFISAILHKSDSEDSPRGAGPPLAWSARPAPVLVICPASAVHNWLAELRAWGHFDTAILAGNERSEVLRAAAGRAVDVVMASIEAARDHVPDLNGPQWSAVIVDEVHRVVSHGSPAAGVLAGLQCRRRVGLTGAAAQEDLRELWSMLDWANPGCIGTYDQFMSKFVRPIELGRRRGAVKRAVASSWQKRELLATLRQRWMLRRTSARLADQLPGKTHQVVYCPPSRLQEEVYRTVLACRGLRRILRRCRPCPCRSGRKASRCCRKDAGSTSSAARPYARLLLNISDHPLLMTTEDPAADCQDAEVRQVIRAVFESYPVFADLCRAKAFSALSDAKYSGKIKMLNALVEHFRKHCEKMVIFCNSSGMWNVTRAYLLGRGLDPTCVEAETPAAERRRLCGLFRRRPGWAVALVSGRPVGCPELGQLRPAAVVVVDPGWRPTPDLQARDRMYRLGLTSNVSVFRLISAGTVEENIYFRQLYRQQVALVAEPRPPTAEARSLTSRLFGLSGLLQLPEGGRPAEELLQRRRRLERLLVLSGLDVSGALPVPRAGAAGLTVSDFAAVAPSDGRDELLTSDDEAERPALADERGGETFGYGGAALVAADRAQERGAEGAGRTAAASESCAAARRPGRRSSRSTERRPRRSAAAANRPTSLTTENPASGAPAAGRRAAGGGGRRHVSGSDRKTPGRRGTAEDGRRRRQPRQPAAASRQASVRRPGRGRLSGAEVRPAAGPVSAAPELASAVGPAPGRADPSPAPSVQRAAETGPSPARTGLCSAPAAALEGGSSRSSDGTAAASGPAGESPGTVRPPAGPSVGGGGPPSPAGRPTPTEALWDRLLESPRRRPPPRRRRRQAGPASDPLLGRWLRDGKVSIWPREGRT